MLNILRRAEAVNASLECGGLAPLCYRRNLIEAKAAPGRRTPKTIDTDGFKPHIGRGFHLNPKNKMRINFAITTLIVSLVFSQQASTVSGNWESVLKLGEVKLRLVLKISEGPNGQLQAVMDSPDQNASNLQVDSIALQGNVLRFEMKKLFIAYEGTLNPTSSEIVGTFTQAGTSAPLIFRKQGAAQSTAVVKRGNVQLKPCNNPSLTSDALCVKYEVFENRATRTGRRIPLNIILLPAKSSKPAPDALFYLAGGPGAAATGYAEAPFMDGLRRNRDVVLVDQRGTGESNPLNCAPFGSREDMRGYFGEQFPIETIRACRASKT